MRERNRTRENSRARAHVRAAKRLGDCAVCWKRKHMPDDTRCEWCADQKRDAVIRLRARRKAAGQCRECGKDAVGRVVCEPCRLVSAQRRNTGASAPQGELRP